MLDASVIEAVLALGERSKSCRLDHDGTLARDCWSVLRSATAELERFPGCAWLPTGPTSSVLRLPTGFSSPGDDGLDRVLRMLLDRLDQAGAPVADVRDEAIGEPGDESPIGRGRMLAFVHGVDDAACVSLLNWLAPPEGAWSLGVPEGRALRSAIEPDWEDAVLADVVRSIDYPLGGWNLRLDSPAGPALWVGLTRSGETGSTASMVVAFDGNSSDMWKRARALLAEAGRHDPIVGVADFAYLVHDGFCGHKSARVRPITFGNRPGKPWASAVGNQDRGPTDVHAIQLLRPVLARRLSDVPIASHTPVTDDTTLVELSHATSWTSPESDTDAIRDAVWAVTGGKANRRAASPTAQPRDGHVNGRSPGRSCTTST